MTSNHAKFSFLKVDSCPHCGSTEFKKDGINHHKQRYRCKTCNKTFTKLTNTFLTKTKKSDSKWKEFVINLTNDATLLASKEYVSINKNTAYLWRMKIDKCLDHYVNKTILKDTVWFDEIFFNRAKEGFVYTEKGSLLRGISKNKVSVIVAIDSNNNCYAKVIGMGKPTSKDIYNALINHIKPGSLIIHDDFHGHQELINSLDSNQIIIKSTDKVNQKFMQEINNFCSLIKRVFTIHLGIKNNHIQDYLNWICLRQSIKHIPKSKRRTFLLDLCCKTKINYTRKRKKIKLAHRI